MTTYVSGKVYRRPIGRYAPHQSIVDHLAPGHAVVELDHEQPNAEEFHRRIDRELKIRFYQAPTRKSYRVVVVGFLRWLGRPPHTATREDVRDWLELLVDGGASSSWVSVHLSALRTMFDKLCGRSITLGLVTLGVAPEAGFSDRHSCLRQVRRPDEGHSRHRSAQTW